MIWRFRKRRILKEAKAQGMTFDDFVKKGEEGDRNDVAENVEVLGSKEKEAKARVEV